MQKGALLAQIVEQLHQKRQGASGHAVGEHVGQGDAVHAPLQGADVGHHLVLQHSQQVLLVAEVVVEGAAGQVGPLA